jgi:nitrate/TMAO reductase-like tetraheme cytochrome c subunit
MHFCLAFFVAVAGVSAADLQPMSSAEFCGRCHRAIFEAWKSSAHARAMESPLFQDVLVMAEGDFGAEVDKTCLSCHSPIAVETGDLALKKKVSWEGVTCDYCHSIRDVSFAGRNPKAKVEFTLVKSGPLKDAPSMAHGTVYSPVHVTSEICAPCHEYKNALGFPVLSTYSEWKNSKYANEGKQCQSCHMYSVAGDVVDPRILRTSTAKVNLHEMPGSHSIAQLTSTVKAQMAAVREGGNLKVTIDVSNEKAGHYVPTGSPLRQIVLELKADTYGGQHFREERAYRRTVVDQHGTPIMREHFAFVKAAKTISDTRLAPGEKRTETFSFPVPAGSQTQLKATFWYYYSPLAERESEKRITFLTINRLVK